MSTVTACWNCGFENPPGARFCANCGKAQRQPCPECGAEVPDGAKFCANCGIRLSAVPASPEAQAEGPVLTAEARKVVTVLFTDLAGSTSLTEQLDPEEARQVVGKFYDVVQHVVERWFAGTVANYLGDAVLAVFGLPVAHEDDPERAVRAGLAIRDAMPVLNSHLAATHGVQLAVRVGINTGEVVAASGSTFERDFLISDAVTTAARLQQSVTPGTVVVGERTHRLTGERIDYRDLPPLPVKGKDAPLMAWAAIAALPEQVEIRRITAPLVGRHGELGLLRHLYQRTRDDARVHLVTILGQPGVGKSRLLREFLAEVRDSEPVPLVLRGRSVAFGGQIGYHALLDILRFAAGLLDTDAPDVVRAKLAQWLRDALPDQAGLLDGLLLTFGTEERDGDPERIRRQMFAAWQSLVAGLAASRPVVLAFEDVHWADEGVLDLIETLAERAGAAPLFIICLTRPELLERRRHWGGGRRNASNIDLEPLRPDEAEQLVAALGSQGLAPDVAKMIAQRAEGNPLFVEELVRMMMEGSMPSAQIPDTVQAVLTARIDRLPINERRTLQAASVVGRTFWPSAITSIAGLTAEEVAAALTPLIEKDLVVRRPASTIAGEPEYAFRHILTRDVAYTLLPKAQRQRAHAQTARWMESRLGERTEEVVEILAEHLRVAGDDRAAAFLHRAGNKARRQYANADAIRLLTQALDAGKDNHAPQDQIGAIYRDRGEVYQLQGSYQQAMTDFAQGLQAARDAGDQKLEATLEDLVGLIHHRQHQLEDAEQHFARAGDIARHVDDRLTLGRSLVDLANVAWDRGKMGPTHPAIVEGLTLLRETDDRSSLARGLNMLCMAHLGVGDGARAIAAAEEALAAARDAADKSKEATSLSYLGHVNSYFGRFETARSHIQAAQRLAEEIGDRRRAAYTLFFMGRVEFWTGNLGEAIRLLEESLPVSQETVGTQLTWVLMYLGECYGEAGDTTRASAAFAEGARFDASSARWWQPSLICRVALAGLLDDGATARRVADEIERTDLEFVPAEGEALLPVGLVLANFRERARLHQFVEARRPTMESMGAHTYLAAIRILEAHLAVLGDDPQRARKHLEDAIGLSRASQSVFTERAALELKVQLDHEPADVAALQGALRRIADSLPEGLRATFLASERATLLRE